MTERHYLSGLDLDGRRVLVVGAGTVAQRRLPRLLAAGAEVIVVAPWATPAVEGMALAGELRWERREYVPDDLDRAWYALACTASPQVNEEVCAEAERRRVFCVRADRGIAGTAVTPATTEHDGLLVGVLSGGRPRRSAAVRDAVRTALVTGAIPDPGSTGAATPAEARPEPQKPGSHSTPGEPRPPADPTGASGRQPADPDDTSARPDSDLGGEVTGPVGDRGAAVGGAAGGSGGEVIAPSGDPGAAAGGPGGGSGGGVMGPSGDPGAAAGGPSDRVGLPGVALVGGGPGDPELITVRGRRLLARADVVVADRLAPRELLDELGPHVEVVDAAKLPYGRAASQETINAVLVEHALAGRFVVRLKGGDPFVYGRGFEELQACAAAGVPVTVVPGVTSAFGVPAAHGVPVTHRGVAHEVVVVSGHLEPDHPDSLVDWPALARLRGTLVLMMAVERMGAFAAALLAGGRAADTPVAVIADGTRPTARSLRTTLAAVAPDIAAAGIRPPAIVVIGPVAALTPDPGPLGGPPTPPAGPAAAPG